MLARRTDVAWLIRIKRSSTRLLDGELRFSNENNVCGVTLTVFKRNAEGEVIQSETVVYKGFAVILNPKSDNDACCHCIIKVMGTDCAEIAMISFRMRKKEAVYKRLDVRLAEVLSIIRYEDRPVAYRMLITKNRVSPNDYDAIRPHLTLNTDKIYVKQSDLDAVIEFLVGRGKFETDKAKAEYAKEWTDMLVRLHGADCKREVYALNSETIKVAGKALLPPQDSNNDSGNVSVSELLSLLRAADIAPERNKLAEEADKDVRELLKIIGARRIDGTV